MAEGFWVSDAGIKIRFQYLAQLVVVRTYNKAIQVLSKELGIKQFEYTTMRDNRVCAQCSPYDGRRYRTGQFMPFIPRHPSCRCYFDLFMEAA